MKRPWSISTTVRNPERILHFIEVIKIMENDIWNLEGQKRFQVLLIKQRYYGFGVEQFINSLSQDHKDIFCDISHQITEPEAWEIFHDHDFKDPAMRGRQSITPLKRFGFVKLENKKVVVTETGNFILDHPNEFTNILFKSFLKWQCPNPIETRSFTEKMGFNISPFIATLKFIDGVNRKWISMGKNRKGISRYEFKLFVPLLINYNNLNNYVDSLIELRLHIEGLNIEQQRIKLEEFQDNFISVFLDNDNTFLIQKMKNNLKDYFDNTLKYFRLSNLFHLRGGGYYIDLEERRSVEIRKILEVFPISAQLFESTEDYQNYLSNKELPVLPWEENEYLIQICYNAIENVEHLENELQVSKKEFPDFVNLDDNELKELIQNIRNYRKYLQLKLMKEEASEIETIELCIEKLNNSRISSLELEKYITVGLNAINDAVNIKPNYPMGDDGEPTFTAPAGKPDIECFYENFKSIYEVTKLRSRDQWFNEGQPVMRHLRDFEDNNTGVIFCIFVAPIIHRDTKNTFWVAVKHGYEGQKQNIIPLTIVNFIEILETILQMKKTGEILDHRNLAKLYNEITKLGNDVGNSNEWLDKIPQIINEWKEQVG